MSIYNNLVPGPAWPGNYQYPSDPPKTAPATFAVGANPLEEESLAAGTPRPVAPTIAYVQPDTVARPLLGNLGGFMGTSGSGQGGQK